MHMNKIIYRPGEKRYVVRHQLRYDSLRHTLDEDDLFRDSIREAYNLFRVAFCQSSALQAFSLQDTGTGEDSFQSPESEIVVRLWRQLLVTKVEKRHDLGSQRFHSTETLLE
jgi:hypothetical protein